MAAMTTALTEFSDKENSRTYTYTGHTAAEPRIVLQKRKVPAGQNSVIEDTISVLSSTEDANGVLLDSKVVFTATIRRPIQGLAADVTAALAIFRDIVAGDEFTAAVNGQAYLK